MRLPLLSPTLRMRTRAVLPLLLEEVLHLLAVLRAEVDRRAPRRYVLRLRFDLREQRAAALLEGADLALLGGGAQREHHRDGHLGEADRVGGRVQVLRQREHALHHHALLVVAPARVGLGDLEQHGPIEQLLGGGAGGLVRELGKAEDLEHERRHGYALQPQRREADVGQQPRDARCHLHERVEQLAQRRRVLPRVRAEHLRPQPQAVDVVPVVHLPVGVGGGLLDGVAQVDGQLADVDEGVLVGGRGVDAAQVDEARGHQRKAR
eukprot:scaffold87476_cov79-Phaeocystis_antarctica.AAC.4